MRRPRGREGKRRTKSGLDDPVFERPLVATTAYENHSCLRKKPHTRQDAVVIAGLMTEKYGVPFVVYECPFCRQWHTGRDTAPLEGTDDDDKDRQG